MEDRDAADPADNSSLGDFFIRNRQAARLGDSRHKEEDAGTVEEIKRESHG